jgi:hypothetical protein
MKSLVFIISVACTLGALAQDSATGKSALQQRIAAIKQSVAQNQQALRSYAWTETTEVSMKGEVKKREQQECRYGPDGKVVKTAVGGAAPAAAKGGRRGLKRRIIEKKVDELKDYMDRVGSLVHRYIPPNPAAMEAAFQAGRVSIDKAAGTVVFLDYAKPGDKVMLGFDPAARKLRSFDVATYLDDAKDAVSLQARFSSLADGTNFLEESVLVGTAKGIQIKTTNFNHHK